MTYSFPLTATGLKRARKHAGRLLAQGYRTRLYTERNFYTVVAWRPEQRS